MGNLTWILDRAAAASPLSHSNRKHELPMKTNVSLDNHISNWFRMLALGTTASLMTLSAAANSYVGSGVCANCHSGKAALLGQSIHSKMIRPNAHLPGVIHGDLRKPNAPKLPPTNDPTNDVHWVMGGHYKEESYIRTNRPGDPYPYTVTQFEWSPIAGTYANTKSLRDWTVMCAGCHTTGYNPTNRTWAEINIGCEACHGPGGDHAASEDPSLIVIDRSTEGCGYCHIRAENVAMGSFTNKQFNFPIGYELGNPSSLQFIPEPLTAVASFYPDGTANRHREQYLEMNHPNRAPSKHYAQGVSCTTCHNPHTAGILTNYPAGFPANIYGIKTYDNVNNTTNYLGWESGGHLWNPISHAAISKQDLCKTCHSTVSDHHVHQFNAGASAANITCVDCHMPDVINIDPVTLRAALPSHRFTAIKPEASIKYGPNGQPNSCTYRCHQGTGADKTARAQWADSIITLKLAPIVGAFHPQQVRLVGTPNYQYALDASTDLANWSPLTTNTAVALPSYTPRWGFEFTDPNSASTAKRFFRARQVYPAP